MFENSASIWALPHLGMMYWRYVRDLGGGAKSALENIIEIAMVFKKLNY